MLIRMMLIPSLLCGIVFAQQAQNQQAAGNEPPETAEVRGIVRALSGDPIPRANITLRGMPPPNTTSSLTPPTSYTASSDTEGNFVLRNIPPGQNYRLLVERPGYVSAIYGSRGAISSGTPLRLVAGQVLEGIDITMTPQAVITGQVTDANGDPMPNVQVQANVSAYLQGRRQFLTRGSQSTDDEGNYRLSGLAAGRYYISAESRRITSIGGTITQTADGSQPLGDIKTYYPNAETTRLATPIRVQSGDEIRGINIQMIQAPVYSISGTVAGAPPGALIPLRIINEDDDSSLTSFGLTQLLQPGQKEFHLGGLKAGSYRLETLPIAVSGTTSAGIARLEFTITDSDIKDAVLTVDPGITLDGVLKLEDGDIASIMPELPEGAEDNATLAALSGAPRVVLRAEGDSITAGGTTQGTHPDGTFELTNLYNYKYSPTFINLPEGTYVKQVKLNGQDVTHGLIDLTSGAGGQLEITLSDKPADINGVVRNEDGGALQGIDVALWPKVQDEDRIAREVKTAVTDQNGGFKLEALGPGDYYLIALESPESGIQQSPEFLEQFVGQAEPVKISEGAHLAVQLDMLSPEAIARALENMP